MSFDLATRLAERRVAHLYRQRPLLESPQGPQVRVDGRARWSTESRVGVQFAEAVDTGALVRPVKAKAVRPRVHRAA